MEEGMPADEIERLGLGLGSIQDNILPNYFLIW
jgi:hypothetical protein